MIPKKAQEILDILRNQHLPAIDSNAIKKTVIPVSLFSYEDTALHKCIFVLNDKDIDEEEVQVYYPDIHSVSHMRYELVKALSKKWLEMMNKKIPIANRTIG